MQMNQLMNNLKDMAPNGKTALVALSAIGGVAALGVVAAVVWNSKRMKTARTIKRAEKILYRVGTAMRNVSGIIEG